MANHFTMRQASDADIGTLTDMINQAFAVERFFAEGERTSPEEVARRMTNGAFFLLEESHGEPVACVYTERRRGRRGYIGLLSVKPSRQGEGHGSALMKAAEDHLRDIGCEVVDINVVNLRTELPPFYRKRGYHERTTAPFPDTGRATQSCHFIIMSKSL